MTYPKEIVEDLVFRMSEGNPGGLRVMLEILKTYPTTGVSVILNLEEMNIKGPRIWVGYKDCCDCDLEKFAELVINRDKDLIRNIGKKMSKHV